MSSALLGKNFMDLNRSTVMLAVEEYLNRRFAPTEVHVTTIDEKIINNVTMYRLTLEAPAHK